MQAIDLGISGLAGCCVAAPGEAMQDEDDDLDAFVTDRQRLAVCPDAEHRVRLARVELGDYGYPHRRCTASVRWSSRAGR